MAHYIRTRKYHSGHPKFRISYLVNTERAAPTKANGGHDDVILPHHHSRFERQIRYRLYNSSSIRCSPSNGVPPHHPTLEAILSLSEAKSLKEVESLIRAVNSKLHDLKSLNLDLLESNSAGLVLVSKIICNKLPRHFLIELFRETSTNYPSFNQLLQVYQSILTRLKANCKDNGSQSKR